MQPVTDTGPKCPRHSKGHRFRTKLLLPRLLNLQESNNAYGNGDFWCNCCAKKVPALTKCKTFSPTFMKFVIQNRNQTIPTQLTHTTE
ncbi:hypothetical protein RHMOL_Rhmol04G0268000 [Rhododendron molle]|uniref:Uncharacterized protein n=1 Tax=Rhododendron molle TaxID=49168 RepID=A0ACC0P4I1_RHOML|nr:hypothetical protein RHMOL_Rhmol04G0268000 [Rhododendron molle]